MTVEEENRYLKDENKYLKARLEESDRTAEKAKIDSENGKGAISELCAKVKYLEGQIEAYQYCVNSRFLR